MHALVGENGAGKSTLMAVAAGAISWDSGTMEIGGQPLAEPSPALAQSLGISVVYQHTSVLDDLTVAENLLYCVPAHRRSEAESNAAWVREQLAAVGAHFDSRTRVSDLSVAERQLVEIAKALALRPKVLVLDEPTEALTAAETERLFAQIAQIKSNGTAVVYISHRLPEVRRIADRISVLRDGRFHGTFDAAGVSEEEILALIIGRSVEWAFPDKTTRDDEGKPLLTARNVRSEILQGVELQVGTRRGGRTAGIEGNGQRDFIRALAGLAPVTGEILVRGASVTPSDPVSSKNHGIIYLPGDRHAEGVLLTLSVRENLTLLVLKMLARFDFVSRTREIEMVDHYVDTLEIKTPSGEATIANLSGGNQQKVLFARSMAAEPVIFLADEPTRGVDAGARIELYRVVRTIAKAGAGVVVLSSDAVELAGLCDRVLVFSRGKIVRSLTGNELTEENITGAAIGAQTQREEQGGDSLCAATPISLGRLRPGPDPDGVDHLARRLHNNRQRQIPQRPEHQRYPFPRQRARLCQHGTIDCPIDRRHRPFGRTAHRSGGRDPVLFRRRGERALVLRPWHWSGTSRRRIHRLSQWVSDPHRQAVAADNDARNVHCAARRLADAALDAGRLFPPLDHADPDNAFWSRCR